MNFFKVFSDPTRIKILQKLEEESLLCNFNESPVYKGNTTIALAKTLKLSQSTLSHHIKILEQSGLVNQKRAGKFIHYFPDFEAIKDLQKAVKNLTQAQDEFKTVAQIKSGPLNPVEFNELCSLIENHGLRIKHTATSRGKLSCYMLTKDKTIILLDSTKQGEILINTNQSNLDQVLEVKALIKRYLKLN